jgi:hypothetical protein
VPKFLEVTDRIAAKTAINADFFVNVKDYGAVGDGVADDREAIQDAIDAAAQSGGGKVFLPAGTYFISFTLTLADNIELLGCGSQSVIKPAFPPTDVNRIIDNDWVNGNENIVLRDFRVDRTGANVIHGILLNGVTNLLIDGIEVSGLPGSGLLSGAIAISSIGPAGSLGFTRLESRNIRVVNCVFDSVDNFGVQVGFVDQCVIANNVAYNSAREVYGVEPEDDGDTPDTARNVSIVGNTIYGRDTIISPGSPTGMIVVTHNSGGLVDGVTVAGNTIRQPGGGNNVNPGITVHGGKNVVVSGNAISNINGSGVQIGNFANQTSGVVVNGNSVTDCCKGKSNAGAAGNLSSGQLAAIDLRNATHCAVSGNYVFGADHTHSIAETFTSSANNLITGNYFRDTSTVGPVNANTTAFANRTASALAGTLGVANGGTGAATLTGVIKGNGTSAITAAVAGTDFVAPGGALGTPSSGNLANCTFPNTIGKPETVGALYVTPGYVSGQYYYTTPVASTSTSGALGNNTLRVGHWVVTSSLSITRLFCELVTAGDANSIFRIGIWNHDPSTGRPSSLVLEAPTISTGSGDAGSVATGGAGGVYEVTVSQTLAPGVYWVGGVVQGAASVQPTLRIADGIPTVVPLGSSLPGTNIQNRGALLTSVSGALGSMASSIYSGVSPARIGFKVA